jgi:hypothetical protein
MSFGDRIPRRVFLKQAGVGLAAAALPQCLALTAPNSSLGASPTIYNGGFEEIGTNGLPVGWHFTIAGEPEHENGGNVDVRVAEGAGRDGGRAIQLSSEISSFPCFFDQDLDSAGKGPLPIRGTISFWYKLLHGTVGRPAITVLGVNPETRDYPGGFFMPVTFANDGQWHHAMMGYDLSSYKNVKSAFVRIYIMSFESRYLAPTTFLVDDVDFKADEPSYIAPRLLLINETMEADRWYLRLWVRNMGLRAATAKFQLDLPPHWEAESEIHLDLATRWQTESPANREIALEPGNAHGLHVTDGSGAGLVEWVIRGRRNAGDEIAVRCLGEEPTGGWIWRRQLAPDPQFNDTVFSRGLIAHGEVIELQTSIKNNGDGYLAGGSYVAAAASSNLKLLSPPRAEMSDALAPGEERRISWQVQAIQEGNARTDLTLHLPDGRSVSQQAELWIDPAARDLVLDTFSGADKKAVLLSSGNLLLNLGSSEEEHGAFAVYYRDGNQLVRLASVPFLGRIAYLDGGREVERIIRYRARTVSKDRIDLTAAWTDGAGVNWSSNVVLGAGKSAGEIEVTATLESVVPRQILAFSGPWLLVGDGSTGIRKDSAQLPGIEWLGYDDVSSNQSHIPGLRDQRVPHPNKITVPALGFVVDGKMISIMWNPRQLWDGENDRPSAVFDSPNRTYGQANHLIGLFVPSVPQWVQESTFKAKEPYDLLPGKRLELSFSIVASDQAAAPSPVSRWYDMNGVPAPPTLDRTYDEEVALCGLNARSEVDLQSTILQSIATAETVLRKQDADGWWTWSYPESTLIQILNWTWAKDLEDFGRQGETSIAAYSSEYNRRNDNLELFRSACYTGDPRFVESIDKALHQARRFERPEGASPWELGVRAADILGAAKGVQAFSQGYKLTGDSRWLERARYWAWAGLPFIYVWEAKDQPHMKYGGIAVYGGSFSDYTLLGQKITWTAQEFAEALLTLDSVDPSGPWRKIVQGIVHNLIMEHEKSGPHKGMWPDWRDVTKDRVMANVWYRDDPRIGRLLLQWRDRNSELATKAVKAGDRTLRVTTNREITNSVFQDGHLVVDLRSSNKPQCQVAIAQVSPLNKSQITSSTNAVLKDIAYDDRYAIAFLRFDVDDAPVAKYRLAIDVH